MALTYKKNYYLLLLIVLLASLFAHIRPAILVKKVLDRWNDYKFTVALWLNLLSSHLTAAPGPPNGITGLSTKPLEHTSWRFLKILDTRPWFRFSPPAVFLTCPRKQSNRCRGAAYPRTPVETLWTSCWFSGFFFSYIYCSAYSRTIAQNNFDLFHGIFIASIILQY